ncbi:MAG: response regulator [Candidatus Cloacimonetes bacterium]|nr:response regulator [Candidatus Cloacimonadota bacterium]
MKILAVDDNFVNRRLLQKIVIGYGDVDHASDGIDAVAAITMSIEEQDPYDLVLLDVLMPNMDGIEVLQSIRSLEKLNGISPSNGVKIIMVTASSSVKHVMTAFREGCESYITKPITKDKVLNEMIKLKLIHDSK